MNYVRGQCASLSKVCLPLMCIVWLCTLCMCFAGMAMRSSTLCIVKTAVCILCLMLIFLWNVQPCRCTVYSIVLLVRPCWFLSQCVHIFAGVIMCMSEGMCLCHCWCACQCLCWHQSMLLAHVCVWRMRFLDTPGLTISNMCTPP